MDRTVDDCIYARREIFTFGILAVEPHPKLALKYLKRILPYAKKRGCLGYPNLSYSVWNHIACKKLLIPEKLCSLYFDAFRSIAGLRPQEKISVDNYLAENISSTEAARGAVTVDILKFLLFLNVQNFCHGSSSQRPRSPFRDIVERWPIENNLSSSRSPDISRISRGFADLEKLEKDDAYRDFALRNFKDALDLMLDQGNSDVISNPVLDAFNLIFRAVLNRRVVKFTDFVKFNNPSLAPTELVLWITKHFRAYPFGLRHCLLNGTDHSLLLNSDVILRRGTINQKSKLVCNFNEDIAGNHSVILSEINNRTVIKDFQGLRSSSVAIYKCSNSYIYLLAPLKSVEIQKCSQSTIVLGAVSCAVLVRMCSKLKLIVATRRISISDVQNSVFNLLTPTQPVLIGSRNQELVFGPHNTNYPKIAEHLEDSGLSPLRNQWDRAIWLSADGKVMDDNVKGLPLCWNTLHPKDFFEVRIPVAANSDKKVLAILPPRYQKTVECRKLALKTWRKQLKIAGLSAMQKKQFDKIVQSRFLQWLESTGEYRQLASLKQLSRASEKDERSVIERSRSLKL